MAELKTYRIQERITHLYFPDVQATSPGEACQKLIMPMEACWVRERTDGSGWIHITPRHLKK